LGNTADCSGLKNRRLGNLGGSIVVVVVVVLGADDACGSSRKVQATGRSAPDIEGRRRTDSWSERKREREREG